ncbi:hypothetical protein R1flu_003871 [Riccia fluitans]|uniref:Uncharacterized protein n=1 Tax=Riccia fluitans TaxID=41844 RepID=A0ABD1YAA0_9MARC
MRGRGGGGGEERGGVQNLAPSRFHHSALDASCSSFELVATMFFASDIRRAFFIFAPCCSPHIGKGYQVFCLICIERPASSNLSPSVLHVCSAVRGLRVFTYGNATAASASFRWLFCCVYVHCPGQCPYVDRGAGAVLPCGHSTSYGGFAHLARFSRSFRPSVLLGSHKRLLPVGFPLVARFCSSHHSCLGRARSSVLVVIRARSQSPTGFRHLSFSVCAVTCFPFLACSPFVLMIPPTNDGSTLVSPCPTSHALNCLFSSMPPHERSALAIYPTWHASATRFRQGLPSTTYYNHCQFTSLALLDRGNACLPSSCPIRSFPAIPLTASFRPSPILL